VYSFPYTDKQPVSRFYSTGLSLIQHRVLGEIHCCELLLTLPPDQGGITTTQAMHLVLDVAAYTLRHALPLGAGQIISPVTVFPSPWQVNAILLAEAFDEPADLAIMRFGPVNVDTLVVVPLFAQEASFIATHGRPAFDDVVNRLKLNLRDPLRSPASFP
jgi:hypothetical protein